MLFVGSSALFGSGFAICLIFEFLSFLALSLAGSPFLQLRRRGVDGGSFGRAMWTLTI